MRIIPGGITGDVQGNDTDFQHPGKTSYRTLEMELMLEKLRQNPESIPSPSRDEMMKMFDTSWTKVCAEIDTGSVFKKNMITLNFDGSEDHLASQKLSCLVGDEMFRFREELLISDLPISIQALNNLMEPPAGVIRNWDVNTTIPSDEGMELIDGEDGNIEDLQRELRRITDSEEEIDLVIETVDVDTDAMDESKAVVENLVDTVSKIVHEGANQDQDMVFLDKLELLLMQGKHETSQSMLPFITNIENLVQSKRSLVRK